MTREERFDLDPTKCLGGDEIINTEDPQIRSLSRSLRSLAPRDQDYARLAFEWVRDEIEHSWDAQDLRITLTASEVLRERVGLCYAKSHLLAALLRLQGIPCALSYQRLADETFGFMLHGLVAIHLDGQWHRQDPRGNKKGVNAQFSILEEQLAWPVDPTLGELDYPDLYVSTAPSVIKALRQAADGLALYSSGLPTQLY